MRSPAIAALEDNPLALRMSGRAYPRRRFRPPWTRDKTRPTLSTLTIIVCALLLLSAVGLLLVPLIVFPLRYGAFERLWRDEARRGRLTDWYLSLTPREIAMGLAGGTFLKAYAGFVRLATAFLIVAAAGALGGWWSGHLDTGITVAFYAMCLVALLPIIASESFGSACDAVAASVHGASSCNLFLRTGRRMDNSMDMMAACAMRVGLPLAIAAMSAVPLMAILWLMRRYLFPAVPESILVGLWSCLSCLTFTTLYFVVSGNMRDEARERAVRAVAERIRDVIEANHPVPGG